MTPANSNSRGFFDASDLAGQVDAMTIEEVDRLPFGAIKLDRDRVVQFYSKAEAMLSGFGGRKAIGLDFFARIAPCMNTDAIRGRLEEAFGAGNVDLEMEWVGDFANPDAEMRIRALSAADGGVWLFLSRR